MKFSYDFKLSEHSGSSRVDVCGGITARIDFLSGSMVRVALFRDDCKMLPTFTVDPQNEFLAEGRDKLSLDGFSLFAPQVNETADGERFSLGNVEAELNTHNFVLSYKKDGKLLFADRAPLAYNFISTCRFICVKIPSVATVSITIRPTVPLWISEEK